MRPGLEQRSGESMTAEEPSGPTGLQLPHEGDRVLGDDDDLIRRAGWEGAGEDVVLHLGEEPVPGVAGEAAKVDIRKYQAG